MPSEALELPAHIMEEAAEPEREPSERRLLFLLRRHDPSAFEALVQAHQNRVYDFCLRMLGDGEEAFDQTQEVFVSVYQNVDRFRADATLKTWILRIARNHCLNRLKYLQRRGRGRSDEYGETNELRITESVGAPTRPDEEVSRQRERALVRRAIERLDSDQRALVLLRDVEGLSYEEIVAVTELPEGTVKSRLHRAREKLAGILAKLEAEPRNQGA